MALIRRLTIASTVATFLLISIGGLVRATKSGLGCGTDWPDCSGRLTPSLQDRAMVIEFSHRAAAGIVLLLLGILALLAVLRYRDRPRIMWASIAAFLLVCWQAVLGMIVVKLELEAESVVLHLGTALLLIAVLLYLLGLVSAVESDDRRASDRGLADRALFAAGSVLVLLLVGSYLSGVGEARGAGFPDWPLIDGRVVPALTDQVTALHFLHRILAVAVGAVVFVVAWGAIRTKTTMPGAARLGHAAAGLYAVELLIGAANVWTQSNEALNSASVTAHLALGALIWGCLVGIAVAAHPMARRVPQRTPRGEARAILEGGS